MPLKRDVVGRLGRIREGAEGVTPVELVFSKPEVKRYIICFIQSLLVIIKTKSLVTYSAPFINRQTVTKA